MKLFKVVDIDEAENIIEKAFHYETGAEVVDIRASLGRTLYGNIISEENIPGFKRSIVDGYAVRSADVFGASEAIPAILNLAGEVEMGTKASRSLDDSGNCVYVPTGGMLPEGSDCVVMIEYSERLDDNTILINAPTAPGENMVDIGEDIKRGEIILYSGTRLRPYEIGVLASLGMEKVSVYKKPIVGIVSTGNEIISMNESMVEGKIRDVNTYLLHSMVIEYGGQPISYGIIKDNYDSLKDVLDKALKECDIVLVSGGSSVGNRDETLKVIEGMDEAEILAHGISIKPGKPTIIARAKGKMLIGLPGHPLACAVVFKVLAGPFIGRLMGAGEAILPVPAEFSINYHKAKGRCEFLPVTLETGNDKLSAEPVFSKSGLITGFSRAWGYIRIEKNTEGVKQGETVYVYRL